MYRMRSLVAVTLLAVLAVPATAAAQVGKSVTIKSPNVATEAELSAVPGFTRALVKELMARRPFLRQAHFDAFLSGSLGAEQRAAAYARVFVPIDLNDVTDAEIRMIPGVGNRMLHEFREYAPYRALAQFHREIGK